ncbi:MAG: VWA domain-containing protein [candidate division WOR-3 bacterium]
MIVWAAQKYLYLLGLVPLIAIIYIISYYQRQRTIRNYVSSSLVNSIMKSFNAKMNWLKMVLLLIGFIFLIVGLARPKWGEKLQIYKGRGIDIVIALDASKSMLAQDVKPSRLERAKSETSCLIDNLGAHQVGITAFAGDCYVMCPLTTDLEAAKLFLDIIEPGSIPRPGTNIEKAIRVSSSLFNPKEDVGRALILITDGENLEGNFMSAVKEAAEKNIRIFAIGIGSIEGSPIPILDEQGNFIQYKKDKDNNIVISRLAERELLVIAKLTDGRYFRSEGFLVNRLTEELDRMKKKDIGGGEYIQYEERYQSFLLTAFILIYIGIFISDRSGNWLRDSIQELFKAIARYITLPRKNTIVIKTFLLVLAITFSRADVGSCMRKGNALVSKGQYEEGLKKYQEALVQEPDNTRIHYNIGRALYRLNKYPEAIAEFQLALLTRDKKSQAATFYNIGNCQFKQGQIDAAINSFKTSLILNPRDIEAKQNLEFCLKIKSDQKNQPKSDSSQKQSEQQPRPQPQPGPEQQMMDRDEANRVLQALLDQEKTNMKKRKERPKREDVEKDW